MPLTSIYICLAALLAGTPLQNAGPSSHGEADNVLTAKAMTLRNGAPEIDLVPEGYGLLKRKDIRQLEAQRRTAAEQRAATSPELSTDPIGKWQSEPLGILVNFGLYSHAAGQWKGQKFTAAGSEMLASRVFMDEYENLAAEFNPTDFDPERIARLAARAGMRVVFTAKHHDGFCLYDTRTTDFNSMQAPLCHRDFVAELSEACRKEAVPFGLFYSLNDWHYPQASSAASHQACPVTPEHLTYIKAQLEELLTHYTAIGQIWFDGGSLTSAQSRELRAHIKYLQPHCLIGGLGNDCGDYTALPEYAFPQFIPDNAWEWADRMYPDTWGYRNWQERGAVEAQVKAHLETLGTVIAAGGNYLIAMALNEYGGIVMHEAQVISKLGDAARRLGLSSRRSASPGEPRPDLQTLSLMSAAPVRKGMPLSRANAVLSHGFSEVDDYYACPTETAYAWMLQDIGLRKVSIDFTAEDLGTFVTLEVDGKTYDIELLPESATSPAARLEFKHQRYTRLPFRENALPDSLTAYLEEKQPFFVSAEEGFSGTVPSMSTIVVERAVYSSADARVPVSVLSGEAAEIHVNGHLVTRHLNRRTSACQETVLLPLHQGQNKVVVKSYNRHGGPVAVAVQAAADQQLYHCEFSFPDTFSGFRHQLRLSRKNPVSRYADARLHNLTLTVF